MNRASAPSSRVSHDVLAACRACAETLQSAAQLIEDETVRARLHAHAHAWIAVLAALGGRPSPPRDSLDDTRATLRRAWLQFQAAAGDHAPTLAECARLEARARRLLADAGDAQLQPEAAAACRAALDRLRGLAPLE